MSALFDRTLIHQANSLKKPLQHLITQSPTRDKFWEKFSDGHECNMRLLMNAGLISKRTLRTASGWLLTTVLALLLMACNSLDQAGGSSAVGKDVYHGFGFDIRHSIPAVAILDFRYGDSGLPGTRVAKYMVDKGAPIGQTGIYGRIKVPDSLWVKWRLRKTGEVFEDKVDLRPLLPADMEQKEITLDIKGQQLFVYLVLKEKRPPQILPNGPSRYNESIVKTLYPSTASTIQPSGNPS